MKPRLSLLRFPRALPASLLLAAAVSLPAQTERNPATALSDAQLARLTHLLTYGNVMEFVGPSKTSAVIALGLLGDERAVPVLIDHLQNEPNQNLRLEIARALGWIGSATAVPALEQALTDTYPFTRQQAAFALKRITGREYDFDKTGLPPPRQLLGSKLPPPDMPR